MTAYEIIAQAIGIIAMSLNILSYQQKEQRNIILMQLFGTSLFAVNMFMLGATVGGILNGIAAVRAFVYSNKQKFRADKVIWVIVFGVLYLVSYALTFTVFDKEPTVKNLIVESIPLIAMFATGIGFYLKDGKSVRITGLVGSPAWLIYNIFNFVIGGMICDVVGMISIIIGMIRHDRKAKQ